MLSKVESGKNSDGGSSSGRLLRDIEEISKALYLHKIPPKPSISTSTHRSKSTGKVRFSESKSKIYNEDLLHKDKKSSIWNWKPFKALTHIKNRRFSCSFFLHVHSIEELPTNFNDISLCVQWKRKDEVLRTRPARVCQGMAEFEETLMHRCSVYSSKNGPHHSAKYEPKLFLLYASVIGAPGLDIGKHWIDLTRLLPLTLEELEEEKSSGMWTTSFRLTGKAKGATLNVSLGFSVMGDNSFESSSNMTFPKRLKEYRESAMDHVGDFGQNSGNGMLRKVGSVPSNSNQGSNPLSQFSDTKILNEVFPDRGSELARSVTYLYQKLDEAKLGSSQEFDFFFEHVEPIKPKPCYFPEYPRIDDENGCDNIEFTIIEQGIESPMKEQFKVEGASQTFDGSAIETIDVTEIFKGDETALTEETGCNSKDELHVSFKDEVLVDDNRCEENDMCTKESTIEEIESVIHNLLISESTEFDYSLDMGELSEAENYMRTKSSYKAGRMVKFLSLDDVTESVANDFLNMLGIEQSPLYSSETHPEPESPRERLLRQFEEDTLSSGNFIFDFDTKEEQVEFGGAAPTAGWGDCSGTFDMPFVIQAAEKDHNSVNQSLRSKRNAKILENLETEVLLQEWGLNERLFRSSSKSSSGGFGSPIHLPPEEPLEFPPLGKGLGPIFETKNGGYLRSMSPSLFRTAKNGLRLIMQVSAPVVLPAAMGSSIMEILQHWATVGSEKMSMQANKLMPLEDITGKTMQQVAWEVASTLDVPERLCFLEQDLEVGQDSFGKIKKIEGFPSEQSYDDLTSSSICSEMDSDYVSLKDLAPLAMDKIEALSIEGLRIQSGMSDEEAPSRIRPQPITETSFLLGESAKVSVSFSLEGATGLEPLVVKGKDDDIDELISLSLTLDEWLRLDAGVFGDEDEIDERTSKILAAHHAKYMDVISGTLTEDSKWGKPASTKGGFLGNNFMVALMVQLRDPLRDYETVGAPMLALIQVERIFIPSKPKVFITVSQRNDNRVYDDTYEQVAEEVMNAEENQEKRVEEGGIPLFKITEVHVAGLNAEPSMQQLWGSRTQQQSGARWLLASCIGKTNKHPHLNSNAIVKSSSQLMRRKQPGDILWSISSHVHGTRAKWKELATLNSHIRNPDVIFLNETTRL